VDGTVSRSGELLDVPSGPPKIKGCAGLAMVIVESKSRSVVGRIGRINSLRVFATLANERSAPLVGRNGVSRAGMNHERMKSASFRNAARLTTAILTGG